MSVAFIFFIFVFGALILRLFLLLNHLENEIFILEEKIILFKKCLIMNNLTLKSKPSSKKIIDISDMVGQDTREVSRTPSK